MQRQLNIDTFWWGIGISPAANKLAEVLKQKRPQVLFSVKKTRRHGERRTRILWTRYLDENGNEKPLDKYVLITSESSPELPRFAIHASSTEPLGITNGINFDAGLYRHLDGKTNLGQTTTAVLERNPKGSPGGPLYDRGFSANLIGVRRLCGPVDLEATHCKILDKLVSDRPSLAEFKKTITRIRADI